MSLTESQELIIDIYNENNESYMLNKLQFKREYIEEFPIIINMMYLANLNAEEINIAYTINKIAANMYMWNYNNLPQFLIDYKYNKELDQSIINTKCDGRPYRKKIPLEVSQLTWHWKLRYMVHVFNLNIEYAIKILNGMGYTEYFYDLNINKHNIYFRIAYFLDFVPYEYLTTLEQVEKILLRKK